MQNYGDIAFTPTVEAHQRARGSHETWKADGPAPSGLGPEEAQFWAERDSFYLASVGEGGWPYVQHRGGPPGFVVVAGPAQLVWADRPGNRQYVSAGNIDHDSRVSLIAVDYPNRRRLKVLGRATWDPSPDPARLAQLGIDGRLEALVTVDVEAFNWNCPKWITPRYTEAQVQAAVQPLTDRILELEAEVARLGAARPQPG